MNYYAPMTHHHMSEETQFYNPPSLTFPTNRFIYVKQNFINPTPKVLVNPHFKKKVYVNPQFQLSHNPVPVPPSVPSKPKIHVNPNVLKSFAPTNNVPKINMKTETKSTVISTRNKLVRVPCTSADKLVRKRRNSLHTKYKIVRSSSVKSSDCFNKFKLDKRPQKSLNTSLKSIKKKYVYVNRFLSINVMAKNVLLKKNSNLSKPGFVNINGILYKKSPNSLRKASDTSLIKSRPTLSKCSVGKETQKTNTNRRSIVKRYKLTRSKKLMKVTPSKLKKCNIPCPVYRKFGKCKGKENGTCIKLHNPNQIVLCTRFLQGACLNENCLLSHKVSPEKMPTCKYFLEGLCSRDDCPYLHVKISPKADICKDFLEGFCKQGAECNKRHQFLCPDFEKNKACPRRRCPYPHGNVVRKSKVLNMIAKKCSATKKENKQRRNVEKVEPVKDVETRYYKDRDLDVENSVLEGNEPVIKTISKNRPKLGTLPAFIPFFEAT